MLTGKKRAYCSEKCADTGNRKNADKSYKSKSFTHTCRECVKTFKSRKKKQTFCGQDCKIRWHSRITRKNFTLGKDNILTKTALKKKPEPKLPPKAPKLSNDIMDCGMTFRRYQMWLVMQHNKKTPSTR